MRVSEHVAIEKKICHISKLSAPTIAFLAF